MPILKKSPVFAKVQRAESVTPGAGTGSYQGTGCPGCARGLNQLGAVAGGPTLTRTVCSTGFCAVPAARLRPSTLPVRALAATKAQVVPPIVLQASTTRGPSWEPTSQVDEWRSARDGRVDRECFHFLRLLRRCTSRVHAERTGLRRSTNWPQTSGYALTSLADRRTCNIPHRPYAGVGNNKNSSAASELCIGSCPPRTIGRRDSA
jgi:hypothetical protein